MGRVNFKMFYIDAEDHLKNLDYFNDFTNFAPSEDLSGQRIAVFHSSVEVSAKTDLTVKLGARIILDFYASEKIRFRASSTLLTAFTASTPAGKCRNLRPI